MDDAPKRLAPARQSLARLATVFGAERTPTLMVLLMGLLLTVTGTTWPTFVLGALILVAGIGGLRRAAKEHPRATQVYRRSLRYRVFYPARKRYKAVMPYASTIVRNDRGAV